MIALVILATWIASAGRPWLCGVQHEPRWATAIGSGRVKVWWARAGAFSPEDGWIASWYRGLDGAPIRWGCSASFGAVRVVAIPLWLPALLSLLATATAWRADAKCLRRAREGACPACGYDRAGLAAGAVCPECGSAAAA